MTKQYLQLIIYTFFFGNDEDVKNLATIIPDEEKISTRELFEGLRIFANGGISVKEFLQALKPRQA